MKTYLEFVFAGMSEAAAPTGIEDGRELARRCIAHLETLEDRDRFPPQLLVLLGTPAFLAGGRADEIVPGVREAFSSQYRKNVPLIGTSVAAVFFPDDNLGERSDSPPEYRIHENGCLLICIASKFLDAKVAAIDCTGEALPQIETLVELLERNSDLDKNSDLAKNAAKARTSQKLLAFLPHLPGPKTHEVSDQLFEGLKYRFPVTGGVSHHWDANSGYQFTNKGAHRGALVAAKLSFDVPVGSGLGWSLTGTSTEVHLKNPDEQLQKLEANSDTEALEFESKSQEAIDGFLNKTGRCLLGSLVKNHFCAEVLLTREPQSDTRQERLRSGRLPQTLRVLITDSKQVEDSLIRTVKEPAKRIGMMNPAGAIALHCTSFLRFGVLESPTNLLREMHASLGAPVVGGYLDGEIGVNHVKTSAHENWAGAALTYGDELRGRAITELGNRAIANSIRKSKESKHSETVEEAITAALEMIGSAGYLDARISLMAETVVLKDGSTQHWLVPQGAIGRRQFHPMDPELLHDTHHLKKLQGKRKEASRHRSDCNTDKGGTPSQYWIPIYVDKDRVKRELLGLVEIDRGEKPEPKDQEKNVLESLGAATEDGLILAIVRDEARIKAVLDHAVDSALLLSSVYEGREVLVQAAVDVCGATSGYVRIPDLGGEHLIMDAGKGPYVDIARRARRKIDATDPSPTGQAFNRKQYVVSNDPQKDSVFNKMHEITSNALRPRDSEVQLAAALAAEVKKVRCLVVVPLPVRDRWPSGIVALVNNNKPWSILPHHRRSVEYLAGKLDFVAQQIQQKISADILQKLGKGVNLQDPVNGFATIAGNCREALRVDAVSVFTKDACSGAFVLKAQSGWYEDGWEDVAFFMEREGFTGSVGLERQPKYRSDLTGYISETRKSLFYQEAMFGIVDWRNDDHRTEVWGLPLWWNDECFAVVTAFRRHKRSEVVPHHPRKHLTTDEMSLLEPAAVLLGAYVRALRNEETRRMEIKRQSRLAAIRRALEERKGPTPEDAIAWGVCKVLGAQEVTFWVPDSAGNEQEYHPYRAPIAGVSPETPELNIPGPELEQVKNNNRVVALRVRDAVRTNREDSMRFGALRRAMIPVNLGKEFTAILDIHWPEDIRRVEQSIEDSELDTLRDSLASYYKTLVLEPARKAEEEQKTSFLNDGRKQLNGMGNAAEEALHQLAHLGSHIGEVQAYINQSDFNAALQALESLKATSLKEARHALSTVAQPRARKSVALTLLEIVEDVLPKNHSQIVKYEVPIKPSLMIFGVRDWTHRAFSNIVENAITWIKRRRDQELLKNNGIDYNGVLSISAWPTNDGFVEIRFSDNGTGMTRAERDSARNGTSKGRGIRLAKAFIEDQEGTLRISSTLGMGTRVVIKLPEAREE